MSIEFYYAIGHEWDPAEPDGEIGFYDYFGEIHRGDFVAAQALRDDIQRRNPDQKFYIYKIKLEKLIDVA